ncbi:unnamed protein product [Calypogeia fissa]
MRGCSVRAIWILNRSSKLVFSRRFPTVERQWKQACLDAVEKVQQQAGEGLNNTGNVGYQPIPFDGQLIQAFQDRKQREGSIQGSGIRIGDSQEGSDSWLDDVITRHVISLQLPKGDGDGPPGLLWPVVLHIAGTYQILILPLVEPQDLLAYERLCWRKDCGNATNMEDKSLSGILLDLPCITASLELAHVLGDIVTGEVGEPEILVNTASTMGGILETLTGGMGLSSIGARAKPVTAPVTAAATAVASVAANATSAIVQGGKGLVKSDKDALRSFISSAMPFGTPLDLNPINLAAIRTSGFSSQDVPHQELKQPAWKPYLYRGKQRILFTVDEVVTAALYDQDDVADVISLGGQILCRADVEGLPEIVLPLSCPTSCQPDTVSYHPCAQSTELGPDKLTVTFSPPLGNFVLAHYTALKTVLKPPMQGFYQLSMVSKDEGAFLIRMKLMEGYKAPLAMDSCSLLIPFPRRKIVSMDGTPSYGSATTSDRAIDWKIIVSGRAHSAKHNDITFSGTVKFSPLLGSGTYSYESEEEVDDKSANHYQGAETGDGGVEPAKWEEPFCWEAYNYAKASFKILGGTMSGIQIDPKTVTVYPQATRPPCDYSSQIVSGDYIFWNSLGRYPRAAARKQ